MCTARFHGDTKMYTKWATTPNERKIAERSIIDMWKKGVPREQMAFEIGCSEGTIYKTISNWRKEHPNEIQHSRRNRLSSASFSACIKRSR
jgi:hypothetical protein